MSSVGNALKLFLSSPVLPFSPFTVSIRFQVLQLLFSPLKGYVATLPFLSEAKGIAGVYMQAITVHTPDLSGYSVVVPSTDKCYTSVTSQS